MTKQNLWMQQAFKRSGKGVFHKQLGVSTTEKIPLTFLQAIVDTPVGSVAHNPTNTGDKMVKVTPLMKKRAVALLNADRANK
jgi:hypothetical protein